MRLQKTYRGRVMRGTENAFWSRDSKVFAVRR